MVQASGSPLRPAHGINPGLSSYLDFMRVLAALTVVLSHLLPNLFGSEAAPGHDAVVVFFVISGYVIAFTAQERDRHLGTFVLHRLARLWSVLVPALLLSMLAAVIAGTQSRALFAPPIADPVTFTGAALQNLLFLGQNWFMPKPAPYNDPAWSLCYEAWYYAVFAAFVFAPQRWRWHAAGLGALLAGPPIMVMMPCWLLGVALYMQRSRLRLSARAAYVLFATCVLLYGVFYALDLGGTGRLWLSHVTANHSYRLRASTRFITDFLQACLFAGTIIAVSAMPAFNRRLAALRPVAKTMSSRTFSLYLFHMPVFVILTAGQPDLAGSTLKAVLTIALVLAACVLLGGVSEARLDAWRRGLAAVARMAMQTFQPARRNAG